MRLQPAGEGISRLYLLRGGVGEKESEKKNPTLVFLPSNTMIGFNWQSVRERGLPELDESPDFLQLSGRLADTMNWSEGIISRQEYRYGLGSRHSS